MREFLKRKLNKKGFTLIELLAVIVILAVLILLALPNVLKIMENARKSAFETEVRSILKAAQTKYAEKSVTEPISSICFSNTSITGCAGGTVDVEGKDDYIYVVKVESTNGTLKYTYRIANNTGATGKPIKYVAQGYQKKYDDDILYDTSSLTAPSSVPTTDPSTSTS